jgi:hypothetical protein
MRDVRGRRRGDVEALAETVTRLSALACLERDIVEIDINPATVLEKGKPLITPEDTQRLAEGLVPHAAENVLIRQGAAADQARPVEGAVIEIWRRRCRRARSQSSRG